MPPNGAACPAATVWRSAVAAVTAGSVLLVVAAVAVAVLEVDPQVLDRLALELGPHPGVHLRRPAAAPMPNASGSASAVGACRSSTAVASSRHRSSVSAA